MKLIKKIIDVLEWIILVIISFILINLLIGWIRFGSFSGYMSGLNGKLWSESAGDLSWNPISRIGLFQVDSSNDDINLDPESMELIENIDVLLSGEIIGNIDTEVNGENVVEVDEQGIGINETTQDSENPYDPDFEDEFNSFFAGN